MSIKEARRMRQFTRQLSVLTRQLHAAIRCKQVLNFFRTNVRKTSAQFSASCTILRH